jgi:hypothetical protein
MRIRFSSNISLRSRPATGATNQRRGVVLLGGMLLLAGCGFFLWQEGGFALYALTGFRWIHVEGTVTSPRRTSKPTIQFTARDGSAVLFDEDYVRLCGGRRSFCFIRDFQPGQAVPVVYDPGEPTRAYVHDWALFATAISWFVVAGIGVLFALLMCVSSIKTPINLSIGVQRSPDLE